MFTLLLVSALISQRGVEITDTELANELKSTMRDWGFIAQVQYRGCKDELRGYLLGIDNDTLYLYSWQGNREIVYAISQRNIESVKIDLTNQSSKKEIEDEIKVITLIGGITTVTHGYLMSITLPGWLIIGFIAYALIEDAHKFIAVDKDNIDELSRYALFHDGIPKYFKDRVNPHPCFW